MWFHNHPMNCKKLAATHSNPQVVPGVATWLGALTVAHLLKQHHIIGLCAGGVGGQLPAMLNTSKTHSPLCVSHSLCRKRPQCGAVGVRGCSRHWRVVAAARAAAEHILLWAPVVTIYCK